MSFEESTTPTILPGSTGEARPNLRPNTPPLSGCDLDATPEENISWNLGSCFPLLKSTTGSVQSGGNSMNEACPEQLDLRPDTPPLSGYDSDAMLKEIISWDLGSCVPRLESTLGSIQSGGNSMNEVCPELDLRPDTPPLSGYDSDAELKEIMPRPSIVSIRRIPEELHRQKTPLFRGSLLVHREHDGVAKNIRFRPIENASNTGSARRGSKRKRGDSSDIDCGGSRNHDSRCSECITRSGCSVSGPKEKKTRIATGKACPFSYLRKVKYSTSLRFLLASKHRLKPARGVVIGVAGEEKFEPQERADRDNVIIEIFGYGKGGAFRKSVYYPHTQSAGDLSVNMFAAYLKKSGKDEKKIEPIRAFYRVVRCDPREVLDAKNVFCENCDHQHLHHECAAFGTFLADFKKYGFTRDMAAYLPNWQEWRATPGLAKIFEVPRVLAVIRAFHRTCKDTAEQIARIASDSLEYFKTKYLSGLSPEDSRKIRWVKVVARHRSCRARNGFDCECKCSSAENPKKSPFGHHANRHIF